MSELSKTVDFELGVDSSERPQFNNKSNSEN